MFKVVCAWCDKHMKGSETADEVSHGICEACQATVVAAYPQPVADQGEGDWLAPSGEGQRPI
jgi:hypothetical protein